MAKQSAGILVFRRTAPALVRSAPTKHSTLGNPNSPAALGLYPLPVPPCPTAQHSEPVARHPSPVTQIAVFLVHPGGPFWAKKDAGAWSIPKGEFTVEDPLDAAKREFFEETGFVVEGEFLPLQPCTQRNGKVVFAWATEADFDATQIKSNTFEIEWPPRSGRRQVFPEVDRAAWYTIPDAMEKINSGQVPLLAELVRGLLKT